MKQVDLFGYKIYENGTILKLNGEPMAYHKTIQMVINGKLRAVSYARVVYYAFHQDTFDFDDHSYFVKHKDNNDKNCDINNLYSTNIREDLRGEKHKNCKLTDKQVAEIRILYYIGEKRNNGYNANYPYKKYSYRRLAEKYNVSHNLIRQIVKGDCRKNG